MLRHIVKYSYDKGVTDQRLTTVEAALKDSHDLRNVVASITPTLESLKESISRLDRALERNANRVFDANH